MARLQKELNPTITSDSFFSYLRYTRSAKCE